MHQFATVYRYRPFIWGALIALAAFGLRARGQEPVPAIQDLEKQSFSVTCPGQNEQGPDLVGTLKLNRPETRTLSIDARVCRAAEMMFFVHSLDPANKELVPQVVRLHFDRASEGAERKVIGLVVDRGTTLARIWSAIQFKDQPQASICSDFVPLPARFDWGVGTSAHQIEGGNVASDWAAWKVRLGETPLPEVNKPLQDAGLATDHWNRIPEDTQLLSDLGVNAYRMGVEWAKIEPQEGQIDPVAVKHYRDEILGYLARGIRPMITLQHFTLPEWVAQKGGWKWEGMPEAFASFARLVYKDIAPEVRMWVTLNEPFWNIVSSYVLGTSPPAEKQGDYSEVRAPLMGMLKTHARAYRVLHEEAAHLERRIEVGMANHLRVFVPQSARTQTFQKINEQLARELTQAMNWTVPDAVATGRLDLELGITLNGFGRQKKISIVTIHEVIPGLQGTQDYLGVNYYSRDSVGVTGPPKFLDVSPLPNVPKNDLGWEIYPEGMGIVLEGAHRRYPTLDIHILENGIADSNDAQRARFIRDHLIQVAAAINAGIPVRSYYHWSLLDNYEWAEGFGPRFGLIAVNYESGLLRTPRASAAVYRRMIESAGVCRSAD